MSSSTGRGSLSLVITYHSLSHSDVVITEDKSLKYIRVLVFGMSLYSMNYERRLVNELSFFVT